ncbi:MAG TPA: hypothetical protein GX697_01220 [Firmicutes bacterium]|nr:hypothetical protein [Bacillota bacterium]
MNVGEKITQLKNYYKCQLKIYLEMQKTAGLQQALCRKSDFKHEADVERLYDLIKKRQEQMAAAERFQHEAKYLLKSIQQSLDLEEITGTSLAGKYPGPEAADLEKTLSKLEKILKNIARLDKESQQNMETKFEMVKQEMAALQKEKQAHLAYKPVNKQREGFFIDHKHV